MIDTIISWFQNAISIFGASGVLRGFLTIYLVGIGALIFVGATAQTISGVIFAGLMLYLFISFAHLEEKEGDQTQVVDELDEGELEEDGDGSS